MVAAVVVGGVAVVAVVVATGVLLLIAYACHVDVFVCLLVQGVMKAVVRKCGGKNSGKVLCKIL